MALGVGDEDAATSCLGDVTGKETKLDDKSAWYPLLISKLLPG